MPKDTDSLTPVLLDLQGLLACQPFTDDVRPAEGEGQQRDQLLQPLGMNNVCLFKAKATTLQAREERFNLPAAGVVRKRRVGRARRDHDHVLTRRKTQPTDKQRQPPDSSRTFKHEWLSNALRAKQARDRNHLAAPVSHTSVLTHPDAKVHPLRAQPLEPLTPDKLTVCTEIRDRVITKDAPELSHQGNALCGVGAAFL